MKRRINHIRWNVLNWENKYFNLKKKCQEKDDKYGVGWCGHSQYYRYVRNGLHLSKVLPAIAASGCALANSCATSTLSQQNPAKWYYLLTLCLSCNRARFKMIYGDSIYIQPNANSLFRLFFFLLHFTFFLQSSALSKVIFGRAWGPLTKFLFNCIIPSVC